MKAESRKEGINIPDQWITRIRLWTLKEDLQLFKIRTISCSTQHPTVYSSNEEARCWYPGYSLTVLKLIVLPSVCQPLETSISFSQCTPENTQRLNMKSYTEYLRWGEESVKGSQMATNSRKAGRYYTADMVQICPLVSYIISESQRCQWNNDKNGKIIQCQNSNLPGSLPLMWSPLNDEAMMFCTCPRQPSYICSRTSKSSLRLNPHDALLKLSPKSCFLSHKWHWALWP